MNFIDTIATQGGSGWLLFSGSLVVIGILWQSLTKKDELINIEKEKRVADVRDVMEKSLTQINNSNNALALQNNTLLLQQKALDKLVEFIDKRLWEK